MTPFFASFARGFRAVVPLWLGLIPFSLAYAVTARGAGLSVGEAQLMSLLVFAGGAQFSAAGLFATGASGLEIILTTFLLNVRHLLYGLSLSRRMDMSPGERCAAAFMLTDEAYGVTLAFLALLVPLLEGWPEVVVAGVSGVLALAVSRVAPGGMAVLVAGVVGSLLGAVLTAGRPEPTASAPEASSEASKDVRP